MLELVRPGAEAADAARAAPGGTKSCSRALATAATPPQLLSVGKMKKKKEERVHEENIHAGKTCTHTRRLNE
jgi:hypothetical protein